MVVQHDAHRRVRPAVGHDDHGPRFGRNSLPDRRDLVVECPGGEIGVCLVETGQGECRCPTPPGGQLVLHLIPRPGTQPVAGDEEDGGAAGT